MFCTTEKDKTIANSITWCLLILEVLYYFPIIESAGLDLPSALDEFAISYPTQKKKKTTKLCFCVHSWWISTLGHGPNKSTLPCSRLVQSKVFECSGTPRLWFGGNENRIWMVLAGENGWGEVTECIPHSCFSLLCGTSGQLDVAKAKRLWDILISEISCKEKMWGQLRLNKIFLKKETLLPPKLESHITHQKYKQKVM